MFIYLLLPAIDVLTSHRLERNWNFFVGKNNITFIWITLKLSHQLSWCITISFILLLLLFTVFHFVMCFQWCSSFQIIINHPPTHFTSRHSLCSFYRVCSFSCGDDSFSLDRLYRLPRVVESGKNTKWSLHNQPWRQKRVWSLLRSKDKRWWVGCLPKAIPWLGWLLPRLGELQSWIW